MSFVLSLLLLATAAETRLTKGVEVPHAIAAFHDAYVKCQDDNFDTKAVTDRRSFSSAVEAAIVACKATKISLVEKAESALANSLDYADAGKRRAAIAEAFDGYDELRREMAKR